MDLTLGYPGVNLLPGRGGEEAVVEAGMAGGSEHCIVRGRILRGRGRGFHAAWYGASAGNDIPIKNPSTGNTAAGKCP